MKLSESLQRDILETDGGGIFNTFNATKRRTTFFFEEIGSFYVQNAERSGFKEKIHDITYSWMRMYFDALVPSAMRNLPEMGMLDRIGGIWVNVGNMGVFSSEKDGDVITISVTSEGLTRHAGETWFMRGFHRGVIESIFGKTASFEDFSQDNEISKYTYRLHGKRPNRIPYKIKSVYDRLNNMERNNITELKTLLMNKTLKIKSNQIFFRGKGLINIESTLFHLLGHHNINIEDVTRVSRSFFDDVVSKEAGLTRNLQLFKTILQAMGWGRISIISSEDIIAFRIVDPPYGLQQESDNWIFIAKTIEGYLQALDRGFSLKKQEDSSKTTKITYVR